MQKHKLPLLICLIFGISLSVNAQTTPESGPLTEGTIRYLVTHNWTKKMAALTYLSKQRKERVSYMYGKNAEWSEYTLLHFTPTETHYLDSEERVNADDMGYSWRRETFWVKRDFAKNTTSDALVLQGKTYLVQDSIRCQDWKILNDMKEVAGHLCMNASWQDTVKQQKIVAWFALDIPHSGGPERLCGLPGLILEVDVNDGAMIITANRIEPKKLTTELDLPKKQKGKKSTEADYQKALFKLIQENIKEEQPYFWDIRY
ncbi:MAG: GLPGLI family protein [Chitinophagales bacterium]|nr:GLPGLI family protein [Chitinophagales bacterium]